MIPMIATTIRSSMSVNPRRLVILPLDPRTRNASRSVPSHGAGCPAWNGSSMAGGAGIASGMTRPTRQAGVLLHPTSLPSRFGVGDLGPCRRRLPGLGVAGGAEALAGPAARTDGPPPFALRRALGLRGRSAPRLAGVARRGGSPPRRALSTALRSFPRGAWTGSASCRFAAVFSRTRSATRSLSAGASSTRSRGSRMPRRTPRGFPTGLSSPP